MHQEQYERVDVAYQNLNEIRSLIDQLQHDPRFTQPGPPHFDPYDYNYKGNFPLVISARPWPPSGPFQNRNTHDFLKRIEQISDVLTDLAQHITDQEAEIQELETAYEEATA